MQYRANPIICKNNEFPVQGVILPQKKSTKKIFGFMPFAKWVPQNFFCPCPPPLLEPHPFQNSGREAVLVGPPCWLAPPFVHHAPFCTFLRFQRMFHESGIRDQGIRDHEGFIWGFMFVVPQSR